MKKWAMCIFVVLLICGLIELLSAISLLTLEKRHGLSYASADAISRRHADIIKNLLRDRSSYIKYSHELGWTVRESGKTDWYTANSAGMRNTREYELMCPARKFRIILCGDGFVHCNDVKDEEAWPALLEQYNPDWEVLNFGVWAYGLDQIYLRYLEKGVNYKSHIVVIGFGSGNIFRLVNTYRPFVFRHTGMPLTKPRFRIENGTLRLVPNPISCLDDYKTLLAHPKETMPMLGINDYYYRRRYQSHVFDMSFTVKLVKTASGKIREHFDHKMLFQGEYTKTPEALDIMMKLTEALYECVTENQSVPVFCIFPNKHDIMRYWADGTKRYSSLLAYFKTKGYQYIDVMQAFDSLDKGFDISDLYIDFYSPLGNRLVGGYMNESLNRIINEF